MTKVWESNEPLQQTVLLATEGGELLQNHHCLSDSRTCTKHFWRDVGSLPMVRRKTASPTGFKQQRPLSLKPFQICQMHLQALYYSLLPNLYPLRNTSTPGKARPRLGACLSVSQLRCSLRAAWRGLVALQREPKAGKAP